MARSHPDRDALLVQMDWAERRGLAQIEALPLGDAAVNGFRFLFDNVNLENFPDLFAAHLTGYVRPASKPRVIVFRIGITTLPTRQLVVRPIKSALVAHGIRFACATAQLQV